MAARFWVAGGSGNWTSTSNWSGISGGTSGASVPSTADTATFNALSGAGTATVNVSVTIQTLTMTGFTGTLAFGTNTISLNSTGTIFTGAATYNVTGTPLIVCTNSSGTSRTINAGLPTEANSISFQFVAGTGSTNFTTGTAIRSLVYSGTFTGSKASSTGTTLTIYGNLTFKSGMTIAAGSGVVTLAATSGTQNIVSAALNLNFPITFSGTATYRLQDALLVGTTTLRTITLTSGTLDLNNFTLTNFGILSSNNNNTRAIAFGTGSYVNIRSASATYWDFPNITNFSCTGTPNVSFSPTSGTCTIAHGTSAGGAEAKALNFTFGNSGATIALSSSYVLDLTLLNAGGVHTYTNSTPTIYGSYFNQNSFTSNAPFTSITLASTNTSRINFIESTGASLPATVNVSGGTGTIYKLLNLLGSYASDYNVSSSLDTNSRNLLCNAFNFNNSNTKTITVSSGNRIEINNNSGGSGIFVGSMVGTTLSLAGSAVQFESSGSFNVPNGTFPELNIGTLSTNLYTVTVGSASNTQTITTINENSNGSSLGKIVLAANSTLNVVDMFYTNNGGITNPLTTTISGTQATLNKTSGTLIVNQRNIRDIVAIGGASFNAPTDPPYNNIDGGNNIGWNFGPIPINATANVIGVEAINAVGTITTTGDANTDLTGVQNTGEVGVTTAIGDASNNVTGVEAIGAVGTITANGNANTAVIGVQGTGEVGTVTTTGAANANISGVQSTATAGTVTVFGNASTLITGVQSTGAAGAVIAVGNGNTTVIGVQATGLVGAVTGSGDAFNNLTGVQSIGSVGTVNAFGNSSASISGVESTGAVGTTTASGTGNVNLTGVQSTGQVGTIIVNGDGQTNLTGAQATAEAGTVTASGGGAQAGNAYPTGVEAIGSVGLVTADGGNVAPVLPNGGIGYPFIIEPDRIYPPRHAVAEVKSAYAKGIVSKIFATGNKTKYASVSLEKMMQNVMLNLLSEQKLTQPTEEELIATLLMD